MDDRLDNHAPNLLNSLRFLEHKRPLSPPSYHSYQHALVLNGPLQTLRRIGSRQVTGLYSNVYVLMVPLSSIQPMPFRCSSRTKNILNGPGMIRSANSFAVNPVILENTSATGCWLDNYVKPVDRGKVLESMCPGRPTALDHTEPTFCLRVFGQGYGVIFTT